MFDTANVKAPTPPVVVTLNEPGVPAMKVVLLVLLKDGGGTTVRVKF
jgi:hypothetical protein